MQAAPAVTVDLSDPDHPGFNSSRSGPVQRGHGRERFGYHRSQPPRDASGDIATGFANVIGSRSGDTLTGDANANELRGLGGNDTPDRQRRR